MKLDKAIKSSAAYFIGIPFYATLNIVIGLKYLSGFFRRKIFGKKSEREIYPDSYYPTHGNLNISSNIILGNIPDKINETFTYTIPELIPAEAKLILLEFKILSDTKDIYEEREYSLIYDNETSVDFFLFLDKLGNDNFDDKMNLYRLWIQIPAHRLFRVEMKNKIGEKSFNNVSTEMKIISYKI